MPLPTPHRRTADLGPACRFRRRQPVSRVKHDLSPLYVLEGAAAIANDRGESRAVFGGNDRGNGLAHPPSFAPPDQFVNPMIGSVH